LEVIKRFPPETPVEVANEYIKAKRADKWSQGASNAIIVYQIQSGSGHLIGQYIADA
jgi:hypothetical protein